MDLRSYPKVELHRHLEGALRLSTVLEFSSQMNDPIPTDLMQQKKHFLVQDPMEDLASVLQKFSATQKTLHSKDNIRRIAFEAVEDAYHEGVKILELRYAPTFIQEGHEHLSFEDIHTAILEGLELARHLPIAVGLIGIIQRTKPLEQSTQVMDFFIQHKSTFVGVDLADNEARFPAVLFQNIFQKAKDAGIKITIHAGEENNLQSPMNVKDAVEKLSANRIGHGLQIIKNQNVLNLIRDRKILLELCPTSNWLTNAVSDLTSHPIKKLIQSGVLVSINSDDPGIFGIDLTNEYLLLQQNYGFSIKDFDYCNDMAAQFSFIPTEIKQKFWPRPIQPHP